MPDQTYSPDFATAALGALPNWSTRILALYQVANALVAGEKGFGQAAIQPGAVSTYDGISRIAGDTLSVRFVSSAIGIAQNTGFVAPVVCYQVAGSLPGAYYLVNYNALDGVYAFLYFDGTTFNSLKEGASTSFPAGTKYEMLAEFTGTALRFKIWAFGASEPSGYTDSVNTSTLTSGLAGFRTGTSATFTQSGAVGVSEVTIATVSALSVQPPTVNLSAGQAYLFTAGGFTDGAASWSATGGTINGAGLYTAGNVAGTFTITATGVANENEVATASVIISGVTAPAPAITTQPANQTVQEPSAATFTVVATGATSYQWQRNNGTAGAFANIVGATNASYASYITPATTVNADNGAQFRCVVTGNAFAGGTTTSNTATLTVTAPVIPPSTTAPVLILCQGPFKMTADGKVSDAYILAYRGDTINIVVSIETATGQPVPLTGGTLTARVTDQAGAQVIPATTGQSLAVFAAWADGGRARFVVPVPLSLAPGIHRLSVTRTAPGQTDTLTFGPIMLDVRRR